VQCTNVLAEVGGQRRDVALEVIYRAQVTKPSERLDESRATSIHACVRDDQIAPVSSTRERGRERIDHVLLATLVGDHIEVFGEDARRVSPRAADRFQARAGQIATMHGAAGVQRRQTYERTRLETIDRKSTRLNSS